MRLSGLIQKIVFIFPFCLPFFADAQDYTQTVRGTIIDRDTELPLVGANIIVVGIDPILGTVTDIDGHFKIEGVPLGRQTLKISYLGYEEQTIPNLLVSSGKQNVLQIKLVESLVKLEEITITADGPEKGHVNNEMATVSARAFTVEETKRYAGSFDDPARMALSFAGVTSNDDVMNELVVRGNSPRGMLWRLEGMEIPNPNHFGELGSSGGGISMLSSHMMSNSDFYTGAFPSEYGNALSGVFDMRMRKGNNEKREYAIQAGLLGTDVAFEGPFDSAYGGSYLINYRYSTLGILNKLGLDIVGDAVPVFQDMSYNVVLPTEKSGTFSLFGLGGINTIEEEWTSDDELLTFKNDVNNKTGIAGITHKYWLNDKGYLKTVVTASGSSMRYFEEVLDSNGNLQHITHDEDFTNKNLRGTVLWNHKANARHTFRVGVIGSRLGYDLLSTIYDKEDDRYVTSQKTDGHTYLAQGYASWNFRMNTKLTLNSGIHYTRLMMNDQQSLEPRLGMKWQFHPRQSFNAGFGVHSRVEDPSIYLAQTELTGGVIAQPNKNLGFAKARHYVVGYENRLTENLNLKTELYYQDLFNVPVLNRPDSYVSSLNSTGGYTTDSLINSGTGKNYGVEITLERYYANQFYFLATASLYQSKYTATDKIERNTMFNSNFATNWLGGKEWNVGKNGKNNAIGISGKVVWAGGRRQTPILLEESIAAGYTVRDESRVFAERAPDYYRFDFQFTFRRNRPKTTGTWKLDIQNVTNHENLWSYYYDDRTQSIRESKQLGLLPVLSYKFEF
ncbi:MAG: TonB-dependent receptor [Flavobacteriales bacterium]|nr:TonB-dependent receptor [Flavobacteriales bacterium]